MKYTFETDSKEEALMLTHAFEAFSALTEIGIFTRNQMKHCEEITHLNALERIRKMANEAMELVQ